MSDVVIVYALLVRVRARTKARVRVGLSESGNYSEDTSSESATIYWYAGS